MSEAQELDTLRLVFAYHVVQQVVAADGVVDDDERAFLEAHWPQARLTELGLLDSTGQPTEAFHQARNTAVSQLRTQLELEQKLELIDTFLQASLSDGHLHHAESAAVVQAARLLDLPGSVWLARLEDNGLVGDVDLPEPAGVEGALQLVTDPDGETVTPADAATATPDDEDTAQD